MSSGSKIEWTTHTFNPWWGCTKVHDGCKFCYAQTWDSRWGGDHWGPRASRRMILGEWSKPAKWNRDAEAEGVVDRVFCASMADLFEDFHGPVVDQTGAGVRAVGPMLTRYGDLLEGEHWTVPALRRRTLDMVRETPWLDWLLLTKRPENVVGMVPDDWHADWPKNVMVGTSPCNQETADASIPALLRVPGRRFLSCEPLLGEVLLGQALNRGVCSKCGYIGQCDRTKCGLEHWDASGKRCRYLAAPGLSVDWVIVGTESNGNRAGRFADGFVEAARSIVAQCRAAGVPVFIKQVPIDGRVSHDMAEWPADLRVRETPDTGGKGAEQ